jgi:hypothetical protein
MLDETYFKESLEFDDLERYRNVTTKESTEHAYNVFSGLLTDKDPEKNEIERFLKGFDGVPEDEFLRGIYYAAIDFAEKRY